jgi:putative oxidoreductase
MLANFFDRNRDIGILFIRVGIGLAFVFVYGEAKMFAGPEMWTKLGAAMSNLGITFAPAFWGFLSASAEFIGGILFTIGLFTRPVAFVMAFNMVVAMTVHFSMHDQWSKVIIPIQLFSVFIAIIFLGAGKYSLDNLCLTMKQKRNLKEPVSE